MPELHRGAGGVCGGIKANGGARGKHALGQRRVCGTAHRVRAHLRGGTENTCLNAKVATSIKASRRTTLERSFALQMQ